jgi:hypothetical protein
LFIRRRRPPRWKEYVRAQSPRFSNSHRIPPAAQFPRSIIKEAVLKSRTTYQRMLIKILEEETRPPNRTNQFKTGTRPDCTDCEVRELHGGSNQFEPGELAKTGLPSNSRSPIPRRPVGLPRPGTPGHRWPSLYDARGSKMLIEELEIAGARYGVQTNILNTKWCR